MEILICTKYNIEKPYIEYYKNNRWCKKCNNSYSRQYYQDNKEKLNKQAKKRHQDNKEKANAHMREYYKRPEVKKKRREYLKKNKEKIRQYQKQYSKDNKAKMAEYGLVKYGLTFEDKTKMIIEQNNKCAICHNEFSSSKHTHVDHCHSTEKVRGILCKSCNNMLGYGNDIMETFFNAGRYILRWKTLHAKKERARV